MDEGHVPRVSGVNESGGEGYSHKAGLTTLAVVLCLFGLPGARSSRLRVALRGNCIASMILITLKGTIQMECSIT